jgi:hypothetical protein
MGVPKTFYIKPCFALAGKAVKKFMPPVWAVQYTDDESLVNCHWILKEFHGSQCVTGNNSAEMTQTMKVPMMTNHMPIAVGDELLLSKAKKPKTNEEEEDGKPGSTWVSKATKKAVEREKKEKAKQKKASNKDEKKKDKQRK